MGNHKQMSPEQMAEYQEIDRQWRLNYMPPQVNATGEERLCNQCYGVLHPLHNRRYDGTVGGFCNKLCAKEYEKKIMDKMTPGEASVEVDKFENWKPRRKLVEV